MSKISEPATSSATLTKKVIEVVSSVNELGASKAQSAQQYSTSQGTFSAVSGVTNINMIMVPSEYHAVQITFSHKGGAGALTGMKMIVAATDDVGDLSLSAVTAESKKYVVPWKDSVKYNDISENGWKEVTWSGSPTLSLPDTGSDLLSFAKSDIIEMSSRPIIGPQSTRFAGYRALIVRSFAGTEAYSKGGTNDVTTSDFIDECGPNVILLGAAAGDKVTVPSSLDENSGLSVGPDKTLPMAVEAFKSDRSAHSFMIVGDSRFASGSTEDLTREYRSTSFFIQLAATEDKQKLSLMHMAKAGEPATVYQPRAVEYMKTGGFVETAVYLVNSINDGTPTETNISSSKAKALVFIDQCLANGITPILVTIFPLDGGYNQTQLDLIDGLQSFVSGLGFRYFSPLDTYGDASGEWLPGLGTGDSHMTDSGYQNLASKIYALIKDSWKQ